MNTFNELFKEFIYVGHLETVDQKYYNLICRYQDKVSERLIKVKKELLEKGKVRFEQFVTEQLDSGDSLMLSLIKKHDKWSSGNLYHQPVILSKGDHF